MIRIRAMAETDIDLGMRLKTQAGWNQLRGDWERFQVMQPDGCFVAEWRGAPAGTAMACLFGNVAWIAMMLVEERLRGRGIGTALIRHALAFVDQAGATAVRLDATPLGQPLYEKLGFQPQYELDRYGGTLLRLETSQISDEPQIRVAQPDDYPSILDLDRRATNTDRSKFLLRLFAEWPEAVQVVKRHDLLQGYLAVRRGSGALQLGPCIAADDVGERLLTHARWMHASQPVFLDLPAANERAARIAMNAGLTRQRSLLRMCRGDDVQDDLSLLWSSSGPELG